MEKEVEIINSIIDEKLQARGRKKSPGAKRLLEDFGFDSLDVMEIIIEAEGEIGITICNSKIHDIYTLDDLYKLFLDEDKAK